MVQIFPPTQRIKKGEKRQLEYKPSKMTTQVIRRIQATVANYKWKVTANEGD